MFGEARKGVDNRTPFQFEQFIMALHYLEVEHYYMQQQPMSYPYRSLVSTHGQFHLKDIHKQSKCIHYHRGWVDGAWSTSRKQLSLRAIKPHACQCCSVVYRCLGPICSQASR